jgi:undecaprenyl diphosphate synthase
MSQLNYEAIPKHIAIIMDGNGRWARQKNKSRNAGHRAGAKTLQIISEAANDLGVAHLTVYAFSTENWSRPKEEVSGLMNLLREYLKHHIRESRKNNIRVEIIGDRTKLDQDIQKKIQELEDTTKEKNGMTLHIALNYGSRDEITRAVKKISNDILENKWTVEEVDQDLISSYLDTAGIPEPDLLIRTSGEQRISNFLLWQIAYSELHFSNKLWPDFSIEDLYQIIEEYQKRNRRFGGI